jgi:hypothetical protein
VVSAAAACSPPAPMKHFVNESSDMGFSLEVFPMGGVHNEYQRPTKKENRAAVFRHRGGTLPPNSIKVLR